MNATSKKARPDIGHIGLLTFFIIGTLVLLYDTLSKSARLENIIIIAPISVLVITLCVIKIVRLFVIEQGSDGESFGSELTSADQAKPPAKVDLARVDGTWTDSVTVLSFMVLLGLYVLGLIYVGFDVSTFLFVLVALRLQGEKRLLLGALYAAFLAVFLTWGLTLMVPFPFTTVFF